MSEKPKSKENNFFEQVYALVIQIPPGRVSTYGAIAECISTKSAARMVGWALNKLKYTNTPIPAHRVVNRNGLLSGKMHFEGPNLMTDLLESEGIKIKNNRIIEFDKVFFMPKHK